MQTYALTNNLFLGDHEMWRDGGTYQPIGSSESGDQRLGNFIRTSARQTYLHLHTLESKQNEPGHYSR